MLTELLSDVNESPSRPALTAEPQRIDLLQQEVCAICLEEVTEQATALPCNHDQFDFPCLGTWMYQQRSCPLCKAEIRSIKYISSDNPSTPRFFHLPVPEPTGVPQLDTRRRRNRAERQRSYTRHARLQEQRHNSAQNNSENEALDFRRFVYRNNLYSSHVGANRISRYRNITHASFRTNPHLVTRAKMFIRRELSAFSFLDSSVPSGHLPSGGGRDRRASNAEFLLEYIVAIVKSVDLKASTGQAEELLAEFLGRDHARLFCHELEAWLKSPYETLKLWDRHVQYDGLRHAIQEQNR